MFDLIGDIAGLATKAAVSIGNAVNVGRQVLGDIDDKVVAGLRGISGALQGNAPQAPRSPQAAPVVSLKSVATTKVIGLPLWMIAGAVVAVVVISKRR